MKKRRYTYLVLILVIGGLLYYFGLGPKDTQSIDPAKVNDVVRAAQKKLSKIDSYRFETAAAVSDLVQIDAETKVAANKQMVDIRWNVAKMSGSTSVYQEGAEVFVLHPLKNEWVPPDKDPTIGPFFDFFHGQLRLLNPVENFLQLDPNDKGISAYKPGENETIDDKTIAIEVIPKPSALNEITKSLPPQLIGADLTDVRQIFWISRDTMLLNKYEVRAKVSFFVIKTLQYKAVAQGLQYGGLTLQKPLIKR